MQNIFSSYYLHAAAQGVNLNHCIIKQLSCYQEIYAFIKRDEMITLEKESTSSYILHGFKSANTNKLILCGYCCTFLSCSFSAFLLVLSELSSNPPSLVTLLGEIPFCVLMFSQQLSGASVRFLLYSAVSFSCQQGAGVSHKTTASQRILSCTNVLQS